MWAQSCETGRRKGVDGNVERNSEKSVADEPLFVLRIWICDVAPKSLV